MYNLKWYVFAEFSLIHVALLYYKPGYILLCMLLITQLQKINNRNIIFMSIAGPGFSFFVCMWHLSIC